MRPFPEESIQAFRKQMEAEGHPKFGVERHGRIFNCYSLPQSKNPALPDFALRLTPETAVIQDSLTPEEITVFGVSDSVRAEVRDLVAGHEIDEFTEIGIEQAGRCKMASLMEIQNLMAKRNLGKDDIRDYLEMRARFFKNLIAYAESKPLAFTPEDIAEFQGSLSVFEMAL